MSRRSHNQPPNPGPGEQHERQGIQDPAAAVVDVANGVRNAAYEAGFNEGDMGTFFEEGENGRAGAAELLALANRLREEGRTILTDNEQKFVDHMNVEAGVDALQARVDFDSLVAGHKDLPFEAAEIFGVQDVIAKIREKIAASTVGPEKAKLNSQIQTLNHYLRISSEEVDDGNTTLENQFFNASHTADTTTGKQKELAEILTTQLGGKMDERDGNNTHVAEAYRILGEYHPRTPNDPNQLDPASELDYLQPGTDTSARTESKEIRDLRDAMEKQELDDVRKELAAIKGRGILAKKALGFSTGMNMNKYEKEILQKYKELSVRQLYNSEDGKILNDPTVDPNIKNYIKTKAFLEEQTQLRNETNEKIKNTFVAKSARWIGKHKLLVVAGSVILVPVTGGASLAAGAALGASLVTTSMLDERYRGLRPVDKSINAIELSDRVKAHSGYADIHNFGMTKYERDLKREKAKRYLHAGGGMGAFFIGLNVVPSTPGIDNFMHNNSTGILQSVGLGVGGGVILRKPKDKK